MPSAANKHMHEANLYSPVVVDERLACDTTLKSRNCSVIEYNMYTAYTGIFRCALRHVYYTTGAEAAAGDSSLMAIAVGCIAE